MRTSFAVVIALGLAVAMPSGDAADGRLLFDTCVPTEARSYEHPAFHVIAVFIRVIPRRGGTPRTVALPDGLCCPNSLAWARP